MEIVIGEREYPVTFNLASVSHTMDVAKIVVIADEIGRLQLKDTHSEIQQLAEDLLDLIEYSERKESL